MPRLLTHADTTQVQFGSSVSASDSSDLLIQSHPAGAGVWRFDLQCGGWEVISSVTCVFIEDAHGAFLKRKHLSSSLPMVWLPPVQNRTVTQRSYHLALKSSWIKRQNEIPKRQEETSPEWELNPWQVKKLVSAPSAPGSPPWGTTSLPCGVSQFSVKPPAPSTQQCDFVTG